jgi:cytochrome c5
MTRKTPSLLLLLVAPVLTTAMVFAQTSSTTAKPGASSATPTAKTTAAKPDDGGKKFDANCGRCHNAPEQLSPSLTGTVVRHMRVRANLSAQDEKDILRYLAP